MELTAEEGRAILWGDHEDWVSIEEDIVDTTRWSNIYEGIFQHIPSQKYYKMWWSVGATESQDEQPFEYDDPAPVEVHEVEKLVKVWEEV